MNTENDYLLGQMLDFHAALVRIKHGILPPDGIPVLTAPASDDSPPATAQLAHALRSVLDLQTAQALDYNGRQGHEQAEAARYLKVALADETLIGLADWPQRQDWIACPLEQRLYGSRSAGERIFDRIDALLHGPAGTQRELAQLYLMALAMGFQGRYRKQEGAQSDLLVWRRKLYRHAYGRWPDSALGANASEARPDLAARRLPQAYQHTRAGLVPRLLPNPRRWAAYFALLLLSLLLLSQLVWQTDTQALRSELEKVEAQGKGSPK